MTDVIEDLEHLLERAVRYLTIVLHDLLQRVHHNRHRPLNSRTLVRWMSAFLPTPKDPRIRLQPSLGEAPSTAVLTRWGSCGSLGSAFSATSLQHLVEEDLGDNLVRFRKYTSSNDDVDDDDECDYDSVATFNEAHFKPIPSLPDRFTSTPYFDMSCSSARSAGPGGISKLAEMEEELATLRKQIAMLVLAQESDKTAHLEDEECESNTLVASRAAALPLPASPVMCSTLNDSGCESAEGGLVLRKQTADTLPGCAAPEPEINVAPPPAPPPPPPPPLPPMLSDGGSSLAEVIKKRKTSKQQTSMRRLSRDAAPPPVPVMSDVLKGLSSVKLRAVERSPGGTPMCRRKLERTPDDPASIIARALKKKFASHRGISPESDQENDASSFLSDKAASPFGQQVLRKAQRKLSLLNDTDDWTTTSSPLKQLNV